MPYFCTPETSKIMTDNHVYTRLTRREKEERLNQSGKVIWMTGLSGAGKTTIALGPGERIV